MSATSTVRTVTVTCACGSSFEREVKRGRPQVWCPSCREVPFYERSRTEVAVVTNEAGVEVPAPKPVNENDPLSHVREQIEADVEIVNAEHKAQFAAMVAGGVDRFEAAETLRPVLAESLRAVYGKYR